MSSRKQPRSWRKHETSKEIWFFPLTLLTLPFGALPPLPQELIMLKLGILLAEPTSEKSLRPSPSNFSIYSIVLWGSNPEVLWQNRKRSVHITPLLTKHFHFFSLWIKTENIQDVKSQFDSRNSTETSKNLLSFNYWSTALMPREGGFSVPVDKPGWHLLSGLKKESSLISPFILCVKELWQRCNED